MNQGKLATDIVENVGGAKNVKSLIHCVTRLRFVLFDEKLADDAVIKNLDGVLSLVKSGGQYQVVIGNQVTSVYDAIMEKYKFNTASEDDPTESSHQDTKAQSWFSRLVNMIISLVGPIIPAIASAGIMKGLLALALSLKVVAATSNTYIFLAGLADAMFYFLPVLVGFSGAKYFKANPYVGAGLGTALCYPTIVGLYTAHKAVSLLGIPVVLTNYTSSLFPVIFAVWLMAKIEHFLNRHVPDAVKSLFVPLGAFIGAIIPTYLVAGPVLNTLSALVSKAVLGIYGVAPIVAGIVLGAFWQVIVISGLHYAFIPVLMNNITTLHYDPVNAILTVTIFAQMAGALGVYLKSKQTKVKTIAGAAAVSALLGVTEPAIYGVSLKFKRVFAMTFIGGGAGGAVMTLMNAKMYAFGANGIFSAPMYINPKGIDNSFWAFIIADLVAFLVTLILTYLFGYKDQSNMNEQVADASPNSTTQGKRLGDFKIQNPVAGRIIPLAQVKDEVFSSGTMGAGFAIEPTDPKVYAPFSGTVSLVFETKHALGLIADNGAELLIHMGVDTVKLAGKPFDIRVQQGDTVKAGQLLAVVDWKQIQDAGLDTTTMVVVTNTMEYAQVDAPVNDIREDVPTGSNVMVIN